MQIENGDMNKCKFSGKFSFVVGYFVSLCPKSLLNLDLVGTFSHHDNKIVFLFHLKIYRKEW